MNKKNIPTLSRNPRGDNKTTTSSRRILRSLYNINTIYTTITTTTRKSWRRYIRKNKQHTTELLTIHLIDDEEGEERVLGERCEYRFVRLFVL